VICEFQVGYMLWCKWDALGESLCLDCWQQ
jgi:hypothetical protein